MVRSHLSRYLGSFFVLCCLSSTTIILWLSASLGSSTAMAGAFVSAASTPCPNILPPSTPGSFQMARGTIKSISGQTIQIISKKSGTPINATYSSTTQITEQASVTTPPASVLLKGVKVEIQAQNTNGAFTATSINLDQADERGDCFPHPDRSNRPDNKATPPAPGQLASPPAGGPRHDDHECFAPAGLASPTSSDKQATCRAMGTVEQLQANTLTITDRENTPHTITLTSSTKILKTASADPSALKVGADVTVMGPVNNGVTAALRITIGAS